MRDRVYVNLPNPNPNQFQVEPRKCTRSKTARMRAHTQQMLFPAGRIMVVVCARDLMPGEKCLEHLHSL